MDPRFSSVFHLARIANALELIAGATMLRAELDARNSPAIKDVDRDALLKRIDQARYEASRRDEALAQDWRERSG